MRNQTSFRLTTTLLPTDTSAKTTDVINKVDSCGCKFKPTFTEETVVLTNDDRTVMETTRAYACNGALCFTKRGLSDDVSETEVANRKLTWNPGSLAFVTAGAADWIDKDDDVTWTGNQTYTGTLTSTCCATYCGDATYKGQLTTEKGVKYPNFATTACLEAYASPFAGMFATVDATGELYRYNAYTCCWDMVSTAALGTYTFVCCTDAPTPGTADTVITMRPNTGKIYLGEGQLVSSPKFADVLLVGGGGGTGGGSGGGGGGVYLGEKVGLGDKNSFCICIGAAGSGYCSNGGTTCMEAVSRATGGIAVTGSGAKGGSSGGSGLDTTSYTGGSVCGYGENSYGGGGGARRFGCGGNSAGGSSRPDLNIGGNGGRGVVSDISGTTAYYGYGGGGATSTCGTQGTTCCGYGVGKGKQGNACPGVAIIRYPTDGSYGVHCATGGTVTTCCGYTIHTFTSNGTFCIVS